MLKSKVMPYLNKTCNQPWYPLLLAILAAVDIFVIVIPTDGILIASTLLDPKRWKRFAIFAALGSTLGGVALAALLEDYEGVIFEMLFPGVDQTETWRYFIAIFEQWGLLVLFFNSASPLSQQPGILIAALAEIPLQQIAMVMFVGRLLKQFLFGYLTLRAPKLLYRLSGVKKELNEINYKSRQ